MTTFSTAMTVTDVNVALAKAEGSLMTIDALQRLGLDDDTDADGVRDVDWQLADVARQLAELSVRGLVPASCRAMFNALCSMAMNVNKAGWTYFYDSAVKDEEAFIAMEKHDSEHWL